MTALKGGEALARTLRVRIANGELQSGDRLPPEDEMMETFGVARPILREALRILESEGLIAIRRGRNGGPRVTTPPIERVAQGFALHLQVAHTTLGDLDDARQLIEPAIAARLARTGTPEDFAALAKAIAVAKDAAERVDSEAFGEAAALVHITLAERGGNQTLGLIAEMLHDVVQRYYAVVARRADKPLMSRAVRSYSKLLTLIEAGDADGAAEHWRKQMSFTIDRNDRHQPLELFGGPDPDRL